MRRRFTAEERQRFVDEVRTTGASVKEVAARLGLDTSIGYRWMQAARQEGGPKFARLIVEGLRPTESADLGRHGRDRHPPVAPPVRRLTAASTVRPLAAAVLAARRASPANRDAASSKFWSMESPN